MMSETGGFESYTPGEGGNSASESVSEQAKQRFAQGQQQAKQQAKDEKKHRRRDDRVARTIRHFMSDEAHAHLFQLISRLSARDCPSIFILAILSLIHNDAREAVEEYIAEHQLVVTLPEESGSGHGLSPEHRKAIVLWTTHLELILSLEPMQIIVPLMLDETNIDGSLLQLMTFVLVDFMKSSGSPVTYNDLQPLTMKIVQDLLEPHMEDVAEHFKREREEKIAQGGDA